MPSYTPPTTRATGYLVTAANWNAELVDNMGYFKDAPVFNTAAIIGAATTAGIRLDLETGSLAVREGDDSAYGPVIAGDITSTSKFIGAAGTTALVSYGATGDPNTGVYFPAADTVALVTGGTERMRVSSAGVVTASTPLAVGTGDGTATPGAGVVRGHDAAGTNISGVSLTLAAGNGTGTGGSGSILLQTAPTAASSATANVLATRLAVLRTGDVAIAATAKLLLDGVAGTGDTYVSESSSNVISFFAGGTEGLRVEGAQVTLPSAARIGWIRGGTSSGPYFEESGSVLRLYTDGAEHFVAFNGAGKRFAINSTQFYVGPGATGSSDLRFMVLSSSGAAGTVVVGHNDATTTPGAQKMTLRSANGSGTNITGATLFLAAGNGTGTGGSGAIVFETAPVGSSGTTANSLAEAFRIDRDGNVGVNVSTFGTSAKGVIGVKNGTEPTTGPADTVQLYSVDRSAGNTIPAIYCEGAGVTNAGITSTTVTTKIAIKVNGTIYYLLATTNAT